MGVKLDKQCKQKGLSLIIAVFSMMLLAILGLTLAMMISGDFELNTRDLESEQAFNLAEAGIQEAVSKLRTNTTVFDADSKFLNRKLGAGEYNVTRATNGTLVTVVSSGFVPSQLIRRAMRQISLLVSIDTFEGKSGMIKNLLDWSAMHAGSTIDGNLTVVDRPDYTGDGYEGNGNLTHNEPVDLAVPGTGLRERVPTDKGYPAIDLDYYYDRCDLLFGLAGGKWLPPVSRWATVTAVTGQSNTQLTVTVSPAIFTGVGPGPWWIFFGDRGWDGKVIVRNQRNDNDSIFQKWGWRNWGLISSHADNQVVLNFNPLVGNIRTVGPGGNIWQVGDTIAIGRYFNDNPVSPLQSLWYIRGDVLFDTASRNINFNYLSVIAEGDIVIRGDNGLSMRAFRTTSPFLETYPNLATQNGDIYSPDPGPLANGSDQSKCNKRSFDGLIYTQNGNVFFNYLDGISIIGNNVTLDGLIKMKYNGRYIEQNSGYIGGVNTVKWQEQ